MDKAGLQGFYLTSIILGIWEGIIKYKISFGNIKTKKMGIKNDVCLFSYQKRMECRYLLGHLLITSACSSKPARRGLAFCAAQVKVWLCLSISWKTRQVISRSVFLGWGGNTRVKVSRTWINLYLMINDFFNWSQKIALFNVHKTWIMYALGWKFFLT